MTFDLALIDPPWPETGGGKSKRGADRHYPVIDVRDMARVVLSASAWKPAVRFWLGIWTTKTSLPDALDLMKACGARYVTAWTWIKQSSAGQIAMGLGHYGRHGVEYILWGRRGSVGRRETAKGVSADFSTLRGEHSAKPALAYDNAVLTFQHEHTPLEMFARAPRAGWNVWGNEVPNVI